jgi:transcriptional regulator with XRE-family HTH domain
MSSEPMPDVAGESDQALNRAIGAKVRKYRLQLGFTVSQLAEHADLSKGMLSKIENAQASPSLATLSRVAGALDVPMSAFFDDLEAHSVIHVKSGQGLDLMPRGSRSGMRSQLLGTLRGNARRVEPVLYTINRNAKVGASYRHPGTEFIHMIEGASNTATGRRGSCSIRGIRSSSMARSPTARSSFWSGRSGCCR